MPLNVLAGTQQVSPAVGGMLLGAAVGSQQRTGPQQAAPAVQAVGGMLLGAAVNSKFKGSVDVACNTIIRLRRRLEQSAVDPP